MNKYCKILIVDDELIMRQGITHMVDWEKEGFKIIGQASNGQEAIEIIQSETPNIVITDVVMPKVDGIELAKYLQENYPDIKILVLSSYSDFDYVKSSFKNGAVDYILKPSLNLPQLLETLKKSASNFFELSISKENSEDNDNDLLGKLLSDFPGNINLKSIENVFIHDSFCLFGINIKILNYSYKSEKGFLEALNYQLNNCRLYEYVIRKIEFQDEYILFLFNFKKSKYEVLKERLNSVSLNCASKFKNVFFVLSKVFSDLSELKDVFENNFIKLCKEGFYHKDLSLIISSQFELVPHVAAAKFDFKNFSQLTAKMEIEESLNILSSYVNEVISQKSLNEFELKTLIQNCFYNIISTLESLDENNSDLQNLKYKCLTNIQQSRYSQELLQNYNELLLHFNKIINEYQNRINSHMINKIIQYINENYAEPLNLSDVAHLFNFNYYYLSSYFSSYIKEGFNEFLNKIRIEKACEFLKQDIPISDISSMVGYSDHSYFCKVFKKFTGVTPSNFRKKSFKL